MCHEGISSSPFELFPRRIESHDVDASSQPGTMRRELAATQRQPPEGADRKEGEIKAFDLLSYLAALRRRAGVSVVSSFLLLEHGMGQNFGAID